MYQFSIKVFIIYLFIFKTVYFYDQRDLLKHSRNDLVKNTPKPYSRMLIVLIASLKEQVQWLNGHEDQTKDSKGTQKHRCQNNNARRAININYTLGSTI